MIIQHSWPFSKVFTNECLSSTYTPILVYHSITPDHARATNDFFSLIETQFDSQMRFLYDHGYKCLTLNDVFQSSMPAESEPGKSFVLTFDDGFEDFYLHAYPILKKYGFVATVFLVADLIGSGVCRKDILGRPRMTWEQINALRAQGFDFGSHTCSHSRLDLLSDEQVWQELIVSKEILKVGLGQDIPYIAYPYGLSNPAIRKTAMQAGYQAAFGVNTGEPDLFNFWRAELNKKDTMLTFTFKLTRWHNYYSKLRGWVRDSTAIGRYLRSFKIRYSRATL